VLLDTVAGLTSALLETLAELTGVLLVSVIVNVDL